MQEFVLPRFLLPTAERFPDRTNVIDTVEPEVIPADDTHRDRLLWIGPDDRGLDLEIVAIVDDAATPTRRQPMWRSTTSAGAAHEPQVRRWP